MNRGSTAPVGSGTLVLRKPPTQSRMPSGPDLHGVPGAEAPQHVRPPARVSNTVNPAIIGSIDGFQICVLASALWGNANPKYFSLTILRSRRNSVTALARRKPRGEPGVSAIQTRASPG